MSIGIIGAMDEEIEILLKEMSIDDKKIKAGMVFHVGNILDKPVVLVRCGIGKVNAAVCTQILIDDFNVDKVINVGIAGGIGENINPGDVVIADNLIQHDMDTRSFGYKIAQIPRMDVFDFVCDTEMVEKAKVACDKLEGHNYYIGRIATGDQFVADVEKIRWLKSEFNAIACEMEGGSIAHVCYLNKTPFVVIRSISDNADSGAHMDYVKFEKIAIKNSTNIIKNILSIL